MNHLMVDIEGLRLKEPWLTPLLQVAMVVFNEEAEVQVVINNYIDQKTLPAWATPEKDTQKFWEDQGTLWIDMQEQIEKNGVPWMNCLALMDRVWDKWKCESVWFAGPTYDQVALESYYSWAKRSPCWRYNDSRDFRTIRKQFPEIMAAVENPGQLHNAVDDALYQVLRLRAVTLATGMTWK